MRLFLISWPVELGLTKIATRLKEAGHEIIYWTFSDLSLLPDLKKEFPGTVFHGHHEALAGKPAEALRDEKFYPVGRDTIRRLRDIESVVLSMMSKRYEIMPVDERKHIYYHMLQYWLGVIHKYNPGAMVFPAAPHTVYDYILYELAKKNNIKTIVFEGTIVGDRMVVSEDFRAGRQELREDSWKAQPGEFGVADLSEGLREYFKKQQAFKDAPQPLDFKKATYKAVHVLMATKYSKARIFKERLQLFANSLTDFSLPRVAIRFFINRFGQNLKKEYKSVESPADFGKNFVYVPLHYQPEQSTITQGDVFVDQRLMVEILSSALPEGWLIYVKEHLYQLLARGAAFFSLRPNGYYRSLAELKNVRIIPIETNTFALIRHTKAVATVSGAAAWEAAMQAKPALLFGHVWFQNGPGILLADDVESCREAFAKITAGYSASENDLIKFLKAFDKISFRGYLDEEWRQASDLPPEENIKNVLDALLLMLSEN